MLNLDGVGEGTALNLYQAGFRSADELAKITVDELVQVRGIGEEKAAKLIETATLYVETREQAEALEQEASSESEVEKTPEKGATEASEPEAEQTPEPETAEASEPEASESVTSI